MEARGRLFADLVYAIDAYAALVQQVGRGGLISGGLHVLLCDSMPHTATDPCQQCPADGPLRVVALLQRWQLAVDAREQRAAQAWFAAACDMHRGGEVSTGTRLVHAMIAALTPTTR